ncbi:hypothetical protein TcBrA4_0103060 [Trypanosoma cruzi]|nr:hypothetical protein TcBrA4_0103060 [Trypanosoma cruzi]
MKLLRLSTKVGMESNNAALRAHLLSLRGTEPVGDPKNPLHVQLQIHDGHRNTLLSHTKELYVTALQHHPETFVNVIPLLPLSDDESSPSNDEDASNDSITLFSAASMTADRGFTPLFSHVALGGTFDRLHAGHKLLLTTALFYASKSLRIGVTLESMLKKKTYGSYIEPFETRCKLVSEFLYSVRRDINVTVVGITEPSGGTNRDAEIEALVVSPETAGVLASINDERASYGLKPLECIQIPYVSAEGDGRVSSTELRRRLHENASGDN